MGCDGAHRLFRPASRVSPRGGIMRHAVAFALCVAACSAPPSDPGGGVAPQTVVRIDDARRVRALVDAKGGVVETAGADGTRYRLAVPAGGPAAAPLLPAEERAEHDAALGRGADALHAWHAALSPRIASAETDDAALDEVLPEYVSLHLAANGVLDAELAKSREAVANALEAALAAAHRRC